MQHIQQPEDSRLCGQTCLAMVLDLSLEEAIQLIGHDKGTTTRELVAALRKMGLRPSGKLIRGEPSNLSIVKIVGRQQTVGWHWAVYNYGTWHDPAWPDPNMITVGRIPSHLRIT